MLYAHYSVQQANVANERGEQEASNSFIDT